MWSYSQIIGRFLPKITKQIRQKNQCPGKFTVQYIQNKNRKLFDIEVQILDPCVLAQKILDRENHTGNNPILLKAATHQLWVYNIFCAS